MMPDNVPSAARGVLPSRCEYPRTTGTASRCLRIFFSVGEPSGDLHGANLRGANLKGAALEGANLQEAELDYANLKRAELVGANLQGANLDYANLQGAELAGAHLERATFEASTTLPDGTRWNPEADLSRFTDPDHLDFWRPSS